MALGKGSGPYINEGKGQYKDSITSYGFGQLGNAHGKTNTPIIPPKGMVIVAIQFIASNAPTELLAENMGQTTIGKGNGLVGTSTSRGPAFINTVSGAHFNGVHESNTLGAATTAANTNIAITANNVVKEGMYVLNIRAADTDLLGIIQDASTATPQYTSGGVKAGTYVTAVAKNASGQVTGVSLSEQIIMNGAENLVFLDEYNGAGGQQADAISYPAGFVMYGRWISVTPAADPDGGIICYFGY